MEYSQFVKMLNYRICGGSDFCITFAGGNAQFFSAMSAKNNNCCYVLSNAYNMRR